MTSSLTSLTPVQQVRVLLEESLKVQTLDPALHQVMIQKIRIANERMQRLISVGSFPHSSLVTDGDRAAALILANEQHTLALLRHLLDTLSHPVKQPYILSFLFGTASVPIDPNTLYGVPETNPSFCCDMLMCCSIILIPCACYDLYQSSEQRMTAREFNHQILLKQHQVMIDIFEQGPNFRPIDSSMSKSPYE